MRFLHNSANHNHILHVSGFCGRRDTREVIQPRDVWRGIDIYFEGDSSTRRWGATDYPDLLANWNQNFFGRIPSLSRKFNH